MSDHVFTHATLVGPENLLVEFSDGGSVQLTLEQVQSMIPVAISTPDHEVS